MKPAVRPFAEQGNYISMHRILFDVVMPILSPNAWKVLCFIVRKTVGWHKEFDVISYSQIQVGTGIKSPNAVSLALHELQGEEPVWNKRRLEAWLRIPGKPQLIVAHKGERLCDGKMETTCYSLNLDFSFQPSMKNIEGSKTKYENHRDNNQVSNRRVIKPEARESGSRGKGSSECLNRDEPGFDFPERLFGGER